MGMPLTVSAPERAILELVDEVPERETFHQADVLVEGLRNLSPASHATRRLPQHKVKRLLLWLAERHEHA